MVVKNMPGSTMSKYSRAYDRVSDVAPKPVRILSMNRYPHVTKKKPSMIVKIMLLPKMFSAHLMSFLPKTIDIRAEDPTPIRDPKAWMIFMMGMVMARPAIAMAPTPCPMKIRSTILYIDAIIWLMTDGKAYIHSNWPMPFVSNSRVLSISPTM